MAVTSQSILVLWNPPPSSEQNGILIGYKILYRVVRDDEGWSHLMLTPVLVLLLLCVCTAMFVVCNSDELNA